MFITIEYIVNKVYRKRSILSQIQLGLSFQQKLTVLLCLIKTLSFDDMLRKSWIQKINQYPLKQKRQIKIIPDLFITPLVLLSRKSTPVSPNSQKWSVILYNRAVINLILDGNFYFASISERQPRVPFEVLHFSSNYYRRENGIDPEWKITDPVS